MLPQNTAAGPKAHKYSELRLAATHSLPTCHTRPLRRCMPHSALSTFSFQPSAYSSFRVWLQHASYTNHRLFWHLHFPVSQANPVSMVHPTRLHTSFSFQLAELPNCGMWVPCKNSQLLLTTHSLTGTCVSPLPIKLSMRNKME